MKINNKKIPIAIFIQDHVEELLPDSDFFAREDLGEDLGTLI